MAIYAIGDLHLSTKVNKPMDKFGSNWEDHFEKIQKDWTNKVNKDDLVLIAGDISWAMNLDDAIFDLEKINALPGKKVLIKGNHDYWWASIKKLNNLFEDMFFIQNNYFKYKEYAICGSRGWVCPNNDHFSEKDEKIYKREYQRIKNSIDFAKRDGFKKIIVMLHYPPTNELKQKSLFTDLFEEEEVIKVIYGHLHGKGSFDLSIKGKLNNIDYFLTSCDYLNFKLKKIVED